jgi:hypothetical protein
MLPSVRRISLAAALVASLGLAPNAPAALTMTDTVLSGAPRSLQGTAEWGGPTVATDGESVNIYFSDSYPVDPVRAQQWADFMTSLLHGPELSTVSIHLTPLTEVQRACSTSGALACYSARTATIYAPAEDPKEGITAKGVVAHEYGHHVATSRSNPPFVSVAYGAKRWASYENVCQRAFNGDLYPGAEDAQHYMLNPGEAFAESYRVLNEQRLGLAQEPWNIVTPSLYPDATALALLEEDVATPWTANTTHRVVEKLTAKVRTRTFTVSTPLDGTLTISSRQTRTQAVGVSLLSRGRAVATSSFKRASGAPIGTTVCGQRAYKVRVTLTGAVKKTAKTNVTLTVSTP